MIMIIVWVKNQYYLHLYINKRNENGTWCGGRVVPPKEEGETETERLTNTSLEQ